VSCVDLRIRMGVVKVPVMSPVARCAAVVIAILVATGAHGADDHLIRYDKDLLTVRVTKMPLSTVLDTVASQAGAQVRGSLRTPHDVTADFDSVPLPEALGRLLGDQNFALVYAHDGTLRAVKLLGGPAAATAPGAVVVAAATPTTTTLPGPADLAALVQNHAPVPVTGRLAAFVGGPNASLTQLLELATRNDDPAIRAEAVRAFVTSLESDPALRAAAVSQINTMDEGALTALLRGAAGDNAEEVAMQVLAHSRAAEIRIKASAILQRLRAGA
jgi:hypothetical protein